MNGSGDKESDLVVGIDSSTTATKAIAWRSDGTWVAEGRAEHPTHSPLPNYYEQNPDDWWHSTAQALQALCAEVAPERIKAVAISNQRETLGMFKRDGTPIAPATVWLDERSRDLYEGLADELGRDPDGSFTQHRITGKPIDLIPSATRIYWMLKETPDLHAKTEVFCDVHGYLSFRLTGAWQTSWASADPLGLFDLKQKRWSPEVMAKVGIDASRLPQAKCPGTLLGKVSEVAAEATGLLAGTPVVAGGGDGQLAGLGCGALDPQTAYLNIGTALVSGVYGLPYINDLAWRTMGGPSGEGYYYECCNRGGTFIVNWFLNTFCADQKATSGEILAALERECADIPIGSNGLLMLPYWQGVMTPHWDNSARGAFIGLSGAHTRAHMFRALMEGLAMEHALCARAVEKRLNTPIETFVAIGGGASSAIWRQIFADVMGKTVARADTVEASSLGAGICAAVGAGWFENFTAAAKAMSGKIVETTTPDPAAHARYGQLMAVYERLYGQLKPLYGELQDFAQS